MNYTEKQKKLLNSIGITDYEYIYWYIISVSQILSDEFIREFKDNIDWDKFYNVIDIYRYYNE